MAVPESQSWARLLQNADGFEKLNGGDDGDFLLDEVFLIAGDEVVNLHGFGGIELDIIFKFRQGGIQRFKNY